MTRPRTALGAVVAVLLTAGAAHAAPDDPPWTATLAAGPVEVRPAYESEDHWSRVRPGDRVPPWSAVRTGRGGRATLTAGPAVVRLGARAWIEIPALAGTGKAAPATTLHDDGVVTYEVSGLVHAPLEVVTPYVVATSGDGAFVVDVDLEGERIAVRAVTGSVLVTSRMDGSTAVLAGGESAALDLSIGRALDVRRPGTGLARRESDAPVPGATTGAVTTAARRSGESGR